MGWSTRHWARRKLEQCIGLLDNVDSHLRDVGTEYEIQHPEVSLQCAMITEGTRGLKEILSSLRDEL